MEAELNRMGDQRWECFFVTEAYGGMTLLLFKRPKISYLQKASKLDWTRLMNGSEE
jgi:hypothetical protein